MKTLEQLAREAGGLTGFGVGQQMADPELSATDWAFSANELARFRAACRAEALEEAAQRIQQMRPCGRGDCDELAAAIRELKLSSPPQSCAT